MYSIVYVSTAKPELTNQEIKEILEFSEVSNNQINISGILMYSEGNFFQVLETKSTNKDVLNLLFSKIQQDPRHYDVLKIVCKQSPDKCFNEYNSSFKTMLNPTNIKELYTFLEQEKKYNPNGYSEIAYLSQKFLALI